MGISPEREIKMKKLLSLAIAAVMSVFMAGCCSSKSECKKEEVKQPKPACTCACQEKGCCSCKKAVAKKAPAKKAAAKPAAKKAPAKKAAAKPAAKKAPAKKAPAKKAPAEPAKKPAAN